MSNFNGQAEQHKFIVNILNSIFINKEDPRNNIQNYIPNNWIVI